MGDVCLLKVLSMPPQWRIQGGRSRHPPPTDQNFLNFMQFFGNFGKKLYVGAPALGLVPPPREILDPPLHHIPKISVLPVWVEIPVWVTILH